VDDYDEHDDDEVDLKVNEGLLNPSLLVSNVCLQWSCPELTAHLHGKKVPSRKNVADIKDNDNDSNNDNDENRRAAMQLASIAQQRRRVLMNIFKPKLREVCKSIALSSEQIYRVQNEVHLALQHFCVEKQIPSLNYKLAKFVICTLLCALSSYRFPQLVNLESPELSTFVEDTLGFTVDKLLFCRDLLLDE
jgi:hypothetical protein